MNVTVCTVDGTEDTFEDVEVTFDTTLLEVDRDGVVTRWPLTSIICFITEPS